MKQSCMLMIWQGVFSETYRCQDFLNMKPVLLNGEPLPDGDYTQIGICPDAFMPNGYVELGQTGTAMSIPFSTSALVWVPQSSSNYQTFLQYMNDYNSGQSVQINDNIATLLNGGQPPPGPCNGLFTCGTTQVQGQQYQSPSIL